MTERVTDQLPAVLVVGDAEHVGELVGALSEPLPTTAVGAIDVVVSGGGDDAIDAFEARRPGVVVVTATLADGDTAALVEALRGMVPRAEVAIIVVGDRDGPIRTALDAIELAPDRFVARPLSARALRFAVASGLEAVLLVRGPSTPRALGTSPGPIGPLRLPADRTPVPPPDVPAVPAPAAVPAVVDDEAATEATPTGAPAVVDDTRDTRAALRARWAALADSITDDDDDFDDFDDDDPDGEDEHEDDYEAALDAHRDDEPAPLPRPPRADLAIAPPQAWRPGTTAELDAEPPVREPTLIISEPPPTSRTRTGEGDVRLAERAQPDALWSEPRELSAQREADDLPSVPAATLPHAPRSRTASGPVVRAEPGVPLDDFDDAMGVGWRDGARSNSQRLEVHAEQPEADAAPAAPSSSDGRDFARQLRARMSKMAERLFAGADAPAPAAADLAPRHDHSTEIDLSSLDAELSLGGGGTEIEARAAARPSGMEAATSPGASVPGVGGSWDSQVRERGLPDSGEIVRGASDAPLLIARLFATGATGRCALRREGVDKVIYFDHGRPVFASSSEVRDRMGELLVREGKITAAQYERCQAVVAESGRRMGEILVDFGYLKRRELLPAVRRHVEDIVYSLFGWERGHYHIAVDAEPSAERIRLSRHPAALVLEGIRRKLDRTTLDRLVGPPSTVIEIGDRERLGGIINMSDLAVEERAALVAFDGQADLTQVARVAQVDVADLLPLAWGLVVLGLATARRTDTEVHDDSTALVGETDLAIDRERVRARWQLVGEADYFALLGVRRDATAFEIRRAYQAARRDFAIDAFPPDLRRELAHELGDIAQVLEEAYRVLRDDRLRLTYLSNLIG